MNQSGHISAGFEQHADFSDVGQETAFQSSFTLVRGTWQLIVIAPFNAQLAVDVLNPVIGFEIQGDQDPAPHMFNSKLVNPQDGTYTFEIRVDKPISGGQLKVRCNLLSHEIPGAPTPTPPVPTPPVPTPPPPPPPETLDEINVKKYKALGYDVSSGMVFFCWVTVVRNKQTREVVIFAKGAFAASESNHDPEVKMRQLADWYNPLEYNSSSSYEVLLRVGPIATVEAARERAENYSQRYYGVPDRYGIVAGNYFKPWNAPLNF